MPMWYGQRIEKGAVAHKIENNIHLLCLRQSLGKPRAFTLHSLRPKPKELFRARLITRRRDYIQPCVSCNVQRRLAKSRSRATKNESLSLFNLQIAIEAGPC